MKLNDIRDQFEAMGVPRDQLPTWDDIQLLTAQLHRPPMLDDEPVGNDVAAFTDATPSDNERLLRVRVGLYVDLEVTTDGQASVQ